MLLICNRFRSGLSGLCHESDFQKISNQGVEARTVFSETGGRCPLCFLIYFKPGGVTRKLAWPLNPRGCKSNDEHLNASSTFNVFVPSQTATAIWVYQLTSVSIERCSLCSWHRLKICDYKFSLIPYNLRGIKARTSCVECIRKGFDILHQTK